MSRMARLAFGLLGLGWAALVAAAVGLAETPRLWCRPEPSAHVVLHWGLLVAGAAIGLSFVPAVGSEQSRGSLVLTWLAAAVTLSTLVVWANHSVVGGNLCG